MAVTGNVIQQFNLNNDLYAGVGDIQYCSDGEHILTWGSIAGTNPYDYRLHCWKAETGEIRYSIDMVDASCSIAVGNQKFYMKDGNGNEYIRHVITGEILDSNPPSLEDLSPDDSKFTTRNKVATYTYEITVYDLETQTAIMTSEGVPDLGHTRFSPDGTKLVIGATGYGDVTQVYDIATGTKEFDLSKPTLSVAITHDNSKVISTDDESAKIYDVSGGSLIAEYTKQSYLDGVDITPSGYVVTGGEYNADKNVSHDLWHIDSPGTLIHRKKFTTTNSEASAPLVNQQHDGLVVSIHPENGDIDVWETGQSYTSIGDSINPTFSVDINSRDWSSNNINVIVSSSDNTSNTRLSESINYPNGIKKLEYAWSQSTNTPSSWTEIRPGDTITQSSDGEWYLHVRAEDFWGNTTTTYYGTYNKLTANGSLKINSSNGVIELGYYDIANSVIDNNYLRINTQSGIQTLLCVNSGSNLASPVKINTSSGIKHVAKKP